MSTCIGAMTIPADLVTRIKTEIAVSKVRSGVVPPPPSPVVEDAKE